MLLALAAAVAVQAAMPAPAATPTAQPSIPEAISAAAKFCEAHIDRSDTLVPANGRVFMSDLPATSPLWRSLQKSFPSVAHVSTLPPLVNRFIATTRYAGIVKPSAIVEAPAADGATYTVVYRQVRACSTMLTNSSAPVRGEDMRAALAADGWEPLIFDSPSEKGGMGRMVMSKRQAKDGLPDYGMLATALFPPASAAEQRDTVQLEVNFQQGVITREPDGKVSVRIGELTFK